MTVEVKTGYSDEVFAMAVAEWTSVMVRVGNSPPSV